MWRLKIDWLRGFDQTVAQGKRRVFICRFVSTHKEAINTIVSPQAVGVEQRHLPGIGEQEQNG